MTPQNNKRPGVIRNDECYTVDEVKRRLAIEAYSFQKLLKAGLKIVKQGRREFVRGAAICELFAQLERGHNEHHENGESASG